MKNIILYLLSLILIMNICKSIQAECNDDSQDEDYYYELVTDFDWYLT